MPRLLKLISDRKAKSKSYSTSPLGHVWKRIKAKSSKDTASSSHEADDAGLHVADERSRLKHPHEELWEVRTVGSGSSGRLSRAGDMELGMPTLGEQDFTDLLEERLNIGFAIPGFSYP